MDFFFLYIAHRLGKVVCPAKPFHTCHESVTVEDLKKKQSFLFF